MIKKWLFKLKMLSHRLSFRAAFFGILAIASSLMAVLFDEYVPDEFADLAGGSAVDGILNVMASSMLIVVTFSLSTMVSAYSSATQIATPRATSLIIDDSSSHSAISIFLGAFIYSVVSIIALSTDYYGEKGRVILLAISILVLAAVVWVVIKWVEDLKNMGSVSETIKRVEKVATKSLCERMKRPTYGCSPLKLIPESAEKIYPVEIGHIENIDVESLAELAQEHKIKLYMENDVGAFVHLKSVMVHVCSANKLNEKTKKAILKCFSIGSNRTFPFDPRYGITVLAGIGVKALSPSLNDPGTAIDVVGALVRVLSFAQLEEKDCEISEEKFSRLFFPELQVYDLFNDAFYSMTKEGTNHLQVVKSLQSAMNAFSESDNQAFRKAAKDHRKLIQERANNEFELESDLKNISSDSMIGENQRHPRQ